MKTKNIDKYLNFKKKKKRKKKHSLFGWLGEKKKSIFVVLNFFLAQHVGNSNF